MVNSCNPNFCFRFETWVPSVTKLMLPYSSIPLLLSFHGKYELFPCMWVLILSGLMVIYFTSKDLCQVFEYKSCFLIF